MTIKTRDERVHLFNGQEKLRLLHISDVHVWFSRRILDELKRIIFNVNPDLIVLTGDYYDTPRGANLFKDLMSEVANYFTIVFIKGNHDLFWGRKVFDLLVGIPNCFYVDEDVYSFKSPGGNKFNIGGWKHRYLFESRSHEVNILLVHNPGKLMISGLKNINLVLAGHLHGGQFIFFTRNGSHYPGSFVYKHCVDRKQLDNTTLIVSKGVGDTFPFRFKCPKEVVKITIE
jgi:uncharacterized protein